MRQYVCVMIQLESKKKKYKSRKERDNKHKCRSGKSHNSKCSVSADVTARRCVFEQCRVCLW